MSGSGSLFSLLTGGELSKVSMVVTLHLVVKDLGLGVLGLGEEVVGEDIKNIAADVFELCLNLGSVGLEKLEMVGGTLGLLLLLYGENDSPAGSSSADNVLVGDGKQISLVDSELLTGLGDVLHVVDHLVVSVSLLTEPGKEGLGFSLMVSICVDEGCTHTIYDGFITKTLSSAFLIGSS